MQLSRALIAAAGAVAASLAFAASAHAIGFTNLQSAPADKAAGANSNFTQHIEFTQAGDDVKNLIVHLPPGQVGDPTATPKCPVASLNAGSCPADTQVGTTTTNALLLDLVPLTIPGTVHNIPAQPGEPARFGIILSPPVGEKVILQAGASLRQSDFGLDTTINNIPNTANGLPITISSLDLTLFGMANGNTFMRNPTSCGEAVTRFEATSYSGATQTDPAEGSASFTPTNCDALEFTPEISASIDGTNGGAAQGGHPGYETVITQSATEAGLKTADVTLPFGLGADNNALGNQCPVDTFRNGTCPENTIVGSAEAESPLLTSPLTGSVALLGLDGGNLGVGIELQGELALKLVGNLGFTVNGRARNLFDGLPDIPIARFALEIAPNGLLLATRNLCEPPELVTEAIFDGHNGGHTTFAAPTPITGCAPTAALTVDRPKSDKPTLELDASASGEPLRQVKLKLPAAPLRFTEGPDFKRNVSATDDGGPLSARSIKGRRRSVTINARSGGTDALTFSTEKGALRRIAPGRLETARVKLTDTAGTVTRLDVTP
jgi:hypothetical protein